MTRYRNSAALKEEAPSPVQNILKSTLKKFGIDKDISRYNFVLHWKEIVGEEIAMRTRPECIRGNALVVRVCNSTWAQELSFQKEPILSRLKKFLSPGDDLNDVMFYVGSLK